MVADIVFVMTVLAGSIAGAVVFKKKFDNVYPLTCMGIIIILYVFGLLGMLQYGVAFICVMSFLLYILSIVVLSRKHNIGDLKSDFFTPGFWVFCVLYLGLIYINHGKLADTWDEFSHWMDCVKAMTYVNDFVTNPAAHSTFQSYPPAMSLFQYFYQKIYLHMYPMAEFSEWRMYMAYQLLAFSTFFPFMQKINFRRPISAFCCLISILVVPLIFYSGFYTTVYIDPFLGIVAGTGFAMILLEEKKDHIYELYIIFECVVLVLSKDAGTYFALFLASAYLMDNIESNNTEKIHNRNICMRVIPAILPLLATIVAKISWKYQIMISKAEVVFGGKIDLIAFGKMLIFQNDTTYKQKVVSNYIEACYFRGIIVAGHTISYFEIFIAFIIMLIILKAVSKKKWNSVLTLLILQALIYIYSLGATYISNFSEYEAVKLASFERYIGMTYLTLTIVIVLWGIKIVQRKSAVMECLFGVVLVICTGISVPKDTISGLLKREYISSSIQTRSRYEVLNQKIHSIAGTDSAIYYISQENDGFDYWVARFDARPDTFSPNFSWSIGKTTKQGDVWTQDISAADWREELLKNYDYVALYKLNDYFYEHYSSLFKDRDKIKEDSLYKINRDTGLLELCE